MSRVRGQILYHLLLKTTDEAFSVEYPLALAWIDKLVFDEAGSARGNQGAAGRFNSFCLAA